MHDVMRGIKVKCARLDGTHYVTHKILNIIFNTDFWYNIIVLVLHSNLTKEN